MQPIEFNSETWLIVVQDPDHRLQQYLDEEWDGGIDPDDGEIMLKLIEGEKNFYALVYQIRGGFGMERGIGLDLSERFHGDVYAIRKDPEYIEMGGDVVHFRSGKELNHAEIEVAEYLQQFGFAMED
jgi:hypothetical protein